MIYRSEHYSLLPHNTFGIDVKADRFIEYDTVEDLKKVIENEEIAEPFLHIGQGSNLLFAGDFHGIILHSLINSIQVIDETPKEVYVKAGSGVVWDDFVAFCVENGWYGAENLSNIPGEVGASAVQNIGAYGVEAKDIIATVETLNLDGVERTYYPEDCKFAYRYSIFKEPEMRRTFITGVTFRLSKIESYKLDYGTIRHELANWSGINLKNVRQAIVNIRSARLPDPVKLGNAGSFFMNPVVDKSKFEQLRTIYPEIPYYELGEQQIKIPAGWLIEKCGWKGKAIGPAGVHEKQALVLVNTGGASGEDIMTLSSAVRESVNETFDINLHPEVKFIN